MPKVSRTHRLDGTLRTKSKRRGEVRRLTVGVNDLKTLYPEIASEMLDGDPTQITKGSTTKFLWKCLVGHTYKMSVAQRTRGRGCAVCAGKQINIGVNDLASRFPEIAKEAYGWDSTTVTFSSNLNKVWQCKKGHTWKANINNRTTHGMGCPFCSGRFPLAGFNDLATTHPEIAKEMYLSDPTKFTFGSGKKVKWKCDKGHIWSTTVNRRLKADCPTCHIRLGNIIIGKNDLKTTHPEIANQADGWDPTTVTAGSGSKVTWKCKLGHNWVASVTKRTSIEPRGCPICSNQKVLIGFNDLNSTNPEIAKLADGWDPRTVVAGSNKKKKWLCQKGHEYIAPINSVVKGTVCPVCSNHVVLQGVNDLATTNPLLANQASGWDPTKIHIGSHKKLAWRCELGHTWKAIVRSRKKNNCPVCSNRVVLAGFNDLATHFPKLSKEADGWDPTEFTFATTKKVPWMCVNGHQWKSTIKNRSQLGRGCPSCAVSGFDPNENGYLYLISHHRWQMLQIGITNYPDDRLGDHYKLGWELLDVRGPMDGHLTRQWETALLQMLHSKGADLSNSDIAGKFDGYSEAWSKSTFSTKSIKELMRLTEEFEESKGVKK